jgi:hypothetical protein
LDYCLTHVKGAPWALGSLEVELNVHFFDHARRHLHRTHTILIDADDVRQVYHIGFYVKKLCARPPKEAHYLAVQLGGSDLVTSVRREKPSFPEYATTAIAIATPHGRRARSATPWRSLVRPRGAHRERSRSRQGPFLPPQ